VSCICVAFCLCLEMILLIAAVSISRPGVAAQGILMEGSCANVKKSNIVLLIPINIVATLIISCSNYVMQCMSAPSRRDLDRAHNLGYHVHVGVSPARNNFHNGTIRQLSWWLIGATSIPVHLMLNSVVSVTPQTNNYLVTIVGPSFLEDSTWSICDNPATTTNDSSTTQICAVRQSLVERPDTYETYSLDHCIRIYSDNIQAEACNVFVLTNSTLRWDDFDWSKQSAANKTVHVPVPQSEPVWDVDTFPGAYTTMDYRVLAIMQELKYETTTPSMVAAEQFGSNSWLCDAHGLADTGRACTQGEALARLSNFIISPASIPIYECRAQKAEEHCSLEYSVIILAVTIGSDAVKLIAMLLFLRHALRNNKSQHSENDLIAALGDAVQSHLKKPDPNTVDRCLMDQIHIRYQTRLMTDPNNYRSINLPMALSWNTTKRRWASVPSTSRWCCFLFPYGGLAAGTAVILYCIVSSLRSVNIYDIWAQGLGKLEPECCFPIEHIQRSQRA